MGAIERADGWELRLFAVIADAEGVPFGYGSQDCFRFACAAIEALTGVDHWAAYAGRYQTRADAYALIAEHGGLSEGMDWLCGPRVAASHARRGDIVCIDTPLGEALGVCLGVDAAVLGDVGLRYVPVADALCAWRIG